MFEANGFHALFGKTQGYYGPYIWRETVPTVYHVELPSGTADYTVNILSGFVFRSWMDYQTFVKHSMLWIYIIVQNPDPRFEPLKVDKTGQNTVKREYRLI